MPSGIDTMTIIVNSDDFIEKEQAILAGLHRAVQPDYIVLESDLALIAVVGRGMKDSRGTSARVFKALAKENINVKMIDQGSSELNIIVGVISKQLSKLFMMNSSQAKTTNREANCFSIFYNIE